MNISNEFNSSYLSTYLGEWGTANQSYIYNEVLNCEKNIHFLDRCSKHVIDSFYRHDWTSNLECKFQFSNGTLALYPSGEEKRDSLCCFGSSFRIELEQSSVIYYCSTVYDSFCRYRISCNCNNYIDRSIDSILRVAIDYLNFTAFGWDSERNIPLGNIVYNSRISTDCILCHSSNIWGYWKRDARISSSLYWIWDDSVKIKDRTLRISLENFLSQNTSYVFIGSSHMRYHWNAMLLSANNDLKEKQQYLRRIQAKHEDIRFQNIIYHKLNLAIQWNTSLINICKNIPSDSAIFLMQIGSWDLTYWPLSLKQSTALPLYINAMKLVLKDKCSRNITFIQVAEMPYPSCRSEDEECRRKRGLRNNYAIQQWNDLLKREIMQAKDPRWIYLDLFDIVAIQANRGQYVCNNHFLCRKDYDTYLSETDVGVIAFEILKLKLCQVGEISCQSHHVYPKSENKRVDNSFVRMDRSRKVNSMIKQTEEHKLDNTILLLDNE